MKISSIREFSSPEKLARKVESVERSKDGVFDVNMIRSVETEEAKGNFKDMPNSYLLEYSVESSRGQNHYDVLATIANRKLYVMTVQYKEDQLDKVSRDDIYTMLSSLRVE